MSTITASVSLTYGGTNSTIFNRPVQQITLLDSTNQQFLRQVMLSNDGVKLIRGNYTVQFPMSELFAVGVQAIPSMSWAPIISLQPSSSTTLYPDTSSRSTASLSITASDEFNTVQYQWYVSSSESAGSGYTLPVNTTHWHFEKTSSAEMSASVSGSGYYPQTASFFCLAYNPSGQTSSSVGYVYTKA